MNRSLLLVLCATGCSRWAYGPTWSAVERDERVALSFESTGTCGELSVANDTKQPLFVTWSDVHVVLPWGERRETLPWTQAGQTPPEDGTPIDAGGRLVGGLCVDLHLFVVRSRPPTAYDFALGWMFGAGVLAGNVAWEPDENKREAVIPDPDAYGWDLVVPIQGDGRRDDVVLAVRGDEVTAFKYTPWAHGEPEDLEQTRVP